VYATAAETELEDLRHEVEAAQGQAQYLNQQWADIHADLLEERDRHEVRVPITSCPHTSHTPQCPLHVYQSVCNVKRPVFMLAQLPEKLMVHATHTSCLPWPGRCRSPSEPATTLTEQRLGTAFQQPAFLTLYMFQSRAYLTCAQCCVISSIPACMHLLHRT